MNKPSKPPAAQQKLRKEWWGRVTSGGRVVIPAEARAALGLADGASVRIRMEDGVLTIIPHAEIVRRLQEKYRRLIPGDRSLVDELIADRRAEAKRE